MPFDLLSAAVGVFLGALGAIVAVWLPRRTITRGEPPAPQEPSVGALCEPCDRGFPTEAHAIDHARDVHKAPDDDAARSLIQVVA